MDDDDDGVFHVQPCSSDFTVFVTGSNIIDYTERRLERQARSGEGPNESMDRLLRLALHHDYVKGHVAVSWRRGCPTYVRLEEDDPCTGSTMDRKMRS